MIVLTIDVGGTHVKVNAGRRRTPIKISSGHRMTAKEMVRQVRSAISDWTYDVVSIGYPGIVLHGLPVSEPRNLGSEWVGFNFQRAFGCPVRIINDAAMQGMGSYKGGRMLFVGVGTGLGTALISLLREAFEVDDVVVGGGNVKLLRRLPRGVRRGRNADAFVGGVRLWQWAEHRTRPGGRPNR